MLVCLFLCCFVCFRSGAHLNAKLFYKKKIATAIQSFRLRNSKKITTVKRNFSARVLVMRIGPGEAISGRINLYRIIFVSRNNYTSSTGPLLATTPRVRSSIPSHFDQRSSIPQIVELVTALLHYFQATASLSTAKETALGDTLTQSANAAVLRKDRCKQ